MSVQNTALITVKRLFLVLAGAVLMALNIAVFVNKGGLLPGGFTGLAILIQKILAEFGSIHIPFSILLFLLNSVPAVICFRIVGKKFTAYSCLMILVCGLLADWLPQAKFMMPVLNAINLGDTLLSALFGGILNAVATVLCLYADASSGGTDFIAIIISEKFRMDSWNYIFAGNCVILAISGYLFSMEKALYSIIFQYVTTVALTVLYKGYQQKTMLIITNKPDEISALIYKLTNHGATSFEGLGKFENSTRFLLYSVVASNEVDRLIKGIKEIDFFAFINVVKTEQLNGRFYIRPKD